MSCPPIDIESAALTLDEILSPVYEPLPQDERDAQMAQQRLARWIALSADGVEAAFEKRLARENRSKAWVLDRLGGVRRRAGQPEPDWVGKTLRVVDVLIAGEAVSSPPGALAFASLLAPLVYDASATLRAALPPGIADMLEPAAFDGVVDHLRRRLANLCELPFYEVLLSWRRGMVDAARLGDEYSTGLLMADTLDAFAAHLRTGGYADLLRDKPVLFRLLAMLVDQWYHSYLSFFTRLAADRERIAQLSSQPGTAARVRHIAWGASDPHNGGNSVLVVSFDDGRRVLYKPKDLRPDRFVQKFIAALSGIGMPEQLVVPEAIALDGYGWTRFVDSAACADMSEVACYYRRFGAWLAIFHVLSTSDMHMENFIAQGSQPVPVDFEMVLQGLRQQPKSVDDDTLAHWLAARFLEESVQSVGMLPSYVQGQDGSLISMGALEPSVYPVQVLRWDAVNTPRMLLRSATEHIEIASNLPTVDGQAIPVARFRDDFLNGFDDTMRFVSEHREAVRDALDAAEQLRLPIRKVVRPTRFYYMLLKRLYDHRNMTDAVAWSMEADFVARLFDWDGDNEEPWKLAGSERRQLHELGIPHFTMSSDSNIVGDRHGPVTRLHVDLGPEVVRARIAALTSASAAVQSNIVRACLQMPLARAHHADDAALSQGQSWAQVLRDEVLRHAFRAPRSIAWMGLNRVDHEVAAQLGPLGHDLYYGSAGIAVFLAALAKAGDPQAAEQCLQALRATIKTVKSPKLGTLGRTLGVGGAVGLGSIVYALGYVGDVLSDALVLEAAHTCAQSISPEAIRADDRFDLVAGAAGACITLLSLHKRAPAEWLVERAIACGDHLLSHRDGVSGMWLSSAFSTPLTGVAHGAAGIALAMSRLFAVTGHTRFREAAQDCVEFERNHFDVALGNWVDLRAEPGNDVVRGPNQWCYGASGIGLARLSMVADGAVSKDALAQDVERALDATLRDAGGRSSGLCCGDASHIEFLAVAASALDRPALMADARERLARLQATWAQTGDLVWIGGTSNYNPGLFQGLAGVGFSALRVSGVQLPSPLLWD